MKLKQKLSASSLVKELTLRVKVTGIVMFKTRLTVGMWLLSLASKVIGTDLEVEVESTGDKITAISDTDMVNMGYHLFELAHGMTNRTYKYESGGLMLRRTNQHVVIEGKLRIVENSATYSTSLNNEV